MPGTKTEKYKNFDAFMNEGIAIARKHKLNDQDAGALRSTLNKTTQLEKAHAAHILKDSKVQRLQAELDGVRAEMKKLERSEGELKTYSQALDKVTERIEEIEISVNGDKKLLQANRDYMKLRKAATDYENRVAIAETNVGLLARAKKALPVRLKALNDAKKVAAKTLPVVATISKKKIVINIGPQAFNVART